MTRKITSKVLGVSLLFLALTGCGKQPEAQAPPPALPVETKNLDDATVQSSSEFVGNIEAKQRVALAPRVAGRVLQIAVQEGDTVKKGDLILELQLDREQGEVEAAQSEVSIQRANVSDAEAEFSAVEAEVASSEAAVQQSQADLREQEARLELAKTNLERARFLVKQGAQSQQSLDDSTRDLNAAKAQTDALKAAVNSSQKELIQLDRRSLDSKPPFSRQKLE
jgi:multidrug efflux pump subunit AcrA (membrane-fusion protein)